MRHWKHFYIVTYELNVIEVKERQIVSNTMEGLLVVIHP
jgi:hypothetical protein